MKFFYCLLLVFGVAIVHCHDIAPGTSGEVVTETDEEKYKRLNYETIPSELWNIFPTHGNYIVELLKFAGYQSRETILKLKDPDEKRKWLTFVAEHSFLMDETEKKKTFGIFAKKPEFVKIIPGLETVFTRFIKSVEDLIPKASTRNSTVSHETGKVKSNKTWTVDKLLGRIMDTVMKRVPSSKNPDLTREKANTPPTVHQVLLLEPVPIANIVGRDVLRLECNASGNPAPSIEWSFNGIKFQLPEEGGGAEGEEKPVVDNRIKIEGNRLTIFKVKGKTRHDPSYYNSGRYRCIASNTIGTVFSEKNIQIRVMGQFTSGHRQTDEKKKWQPSVGRSYQIKCPPHSFGHGTEYRWGVVPILSGQPEYWLPGEKNKKMFYKSDGTLVWSFISFDDMKESRDIGGLRCIMINFGHFVASNQQVLWQPYTVVKRVRKPIFEAKLSPTMIAPIDSELVLSCGAKGIPAPTYHWQYNGRDIVSRHNNSNELNFEHFQFSGHQMQLRIRRITRYSGGKFTCFARSVIGEVWSHGKLSVSFPPRWIDKFPDSIDVVVGNPFELVCNVTGFPQPIIEWYQNSTRIFTRDERKIVTGDKEGDIGGKLTLTSARYQDGGIYICLARNYLDTLTMSVYVKIQDKNVIV